MRNAYPENFSPPAQVFIEISPQMVIFFKNFQYAFYGFDLSETHRSLVSYDESSLGIISQFLKPSPSDSDLIG